MAIPSMMLARNSVERGAIWCVKGAMIGARLILTWLWVVVGFLGTPKAHAAMLSAASDPAELRNGGPSFESQSLSNLFALQCRAALRFSRRFNFRAALNDGDGSLSGSTADMPPRKCAGQYYAAAQVCLDPAGGWQFRNRAAADPRAP